MVVFWLILANNQNNLRFIHLQLIHLKFTIKMKKILAVVASLLLCVGVMAQKQIVVKNTANFDRAAEMVEVKVAAKNALSLNKQLVLKNANGQEVPYQLVYGSDNKLTGFIFQADVKAKSTVVYQLVEGKPSAVKFLTHARFVPERKDDLAWENDLAAYRMYGPALAKENPSNGVDLWLKRTADTIVSKRYRDELKKGLSYHTDWGDGLDCYGVGHTLGCGGIAPYQNGKLYVGDHFNRYEIIENGPLRSTFTLYYENVKVGGVVMNQEITISTTAGSALNKAVVKYTGKVPFQLAAGIVLHNDKGIKHSNVKTGVIAYAEDAISSAKLPSGRNYIGVVMPCKAKAIATQDNHLLITAKYKPESNFTYYFGGGWSKWHFTTDADWFSAMEQFSKRVKQPLQVKFK